ncbi:hypothetical protein BGW37DRAFT_121809 [Umbelopsis sp. PMI_123]|nr:hypothetical protein BGW37DRAFT_121809 [Umbelopsis sp. PMI_123]
MSIINNYNPSLKYYATTYCAQIQTFHACLQQWKAQPKLVSKLLLFGILEEDNWDSYNHSDDAKSYDISIKVTLTVPPDFIQRSFLIGDIRCMQSLWKSWARDEMMQFTGIYFAVLGGAYSSLAKANSRYALKAGSLAIHQIKLAQLLNDTVQECKCWLYYAEDLIHLGKLAKARRILRKQYQFAKDSQNGLLQKMCQSVHHKLEVKEQARMFEDMQSHLMYRLDAISI